MLDRKKRPEAACFAATGKMSGCNTTESCRPSSKVGGGQENDG